MKYRNWTLGQTEALLNILGGEEKANAILARTVEVVLKVVSYISATYTELIRYSRPIKKLTATYDWANDNITNDNFPSSESGEKEVEFGMFHFNRVISSEDAISRMKAEDCHPATAKETLSFGEKHPKLQLEYPIVGLGSVAELYGDRCVVYLHRLDSKRSADLGYFGSGFLGCCRFLSVRN